MKTIKFPYTVRVGSASAKVYKTPNKGRESYSVSFYDADGRRVRRMYTSQDTAIAEAENLLRSFMSGNGDFRGMSDLDRLIYSRATDYVRPLGIPLDHSAREYAEAQKLLEGTGYTLTEAVRAFRQNNASPIRRLTVRETVEELLQDRRDNDVSGYHLRDLEGRLQKFSEAFQCRLDSVTPDEIEAYLKSLTVSPRTIKNHRTTLSILFNFAKSHGILPQNHPGVRPGPRIRVAEQQVELFTPQEMRTLLKAADPRALPAIAIGGFAGVRSEEIRRLDWDDVKLDRGFIEIHAQNAKKRTRRLSPISDNLREWLSPLQQASGSVLPYRNYSNTLLKLSQAAGVPWKRNALRKTFISSRVSVSGDIAKTAIEAGTSPEMIQRNYLEAVDPATAQEWFNIRPGDAT